MSFAKKPHIMLLAGETSGDAHAAAFVLEINRIQPGIEFSGMGGTEMQKAGVNLFFDSALIAVMGLVEILKHWGDIKRAMKRVFTRVSILVPGFLSQKIRKSLLCRLCVFSCQLSVTAY